MYNATKWVIAVVVIILILLGLWWGGFLGGGVPTNSGAQSGAAVNSADNPPLDTSDAVIAEESAAIEAQMKVAGNQFAAFSQSPTAAKADLLVGQFSSVSAMMQKLSDRFQARVTILKSLGINTDVMQGAVNDMKIQLSYATSQAGVAGQNLYKIMEAKGSSSQSNINSAALMQAQIELQKSEIYLAAAEKDIKTVVDGFKTVSASQTRH